MRYLRCLFHRAISRCSCQGLISATFPFRCSVGVLALVYHTWSRFRPSHVFTKPPKKTDPCSEIAVCCLRYIPIESFNHSVYEIKLILLPYLTLVVFVAIGLTVRMIGFRPSLLDNLELMCIVKLSLQHPDRVNRKRRFFYCSLHWDPL